MSILSVKQTDNQQVQNPFSQSGPSYWNSEVEKMKKVFAAMQNCPSSPAKCQKMDLSIELECFRKKWVPQQKIELVSSPEIRKIETALICELAQGLQAYLSAIETMSPENASKLEQLICENAPEGYLPILNIMILHALKGDSSQKLLALFKDHSAKLTSLKTTVAQLSDHEIEKLYNWFLGENTSLTKAEKQLVKEIEKISNDCKNTKFASVFLTCFSKMVYQYHVSMPLLFESLKTNHELIDGCQEAFKSLNPYVQYFFLLLMSDSQLPEILLPKNVTSSSFQTFKDRCKRLTIHELEELAMHFSSRLSTNNLWTTRADIEFLIGRDISQNRPFYAALMKAWEAYTVSSLQSEKPILSPVSSTSSTNEKRGLCKVQ